MHHNFSNYIDDDNMVTTGDDVDDVKAAATSFIMYKIGKLALLDIIVSCVLKTNEQAALFYSVL